MFLKQNSGGDKRTTNNKRLVIHNDESNKASEIVESSTAPMPSAAPLTPLKLLNEKCNETQDYNKFLTFEYNRLNKKGDFDPTEEVDKLALKLFRAELKDIKKSNWSIYCFNIRKKEVYIRKENKWCIPIFTDWEYIIKSAFSKVAATIIQWGTKKRVENENNISDSHDQAIIQTIIYAANFKEKFFSSKVKVDNMIHKIMELCLVSVEEIEYDLTQITPKTDPLPDPEDISTLMQRKKKEEEEKQNEMKKRKKENSFFRNENNSFFRNEKVIVESSIEKNNNEDDSEEEDDTEEENEKEEEKQVDEKEEKEKDEGVESSDIDDDDDDDDLD